MDTTELDRIIRKSATPRLRDADPLARANWLRAAQGHPPLTRRTVEHDRSLSAYDRALGEGRN
jgi:hypothetical protein